LLVIHHYPFNCNIKPNYPFIGQFIEASYQKSKEIPYPRR